MYRQILLDMQEYLLQYFPGVLLTGLFLSVLLTVSRCRKKNTAVGWKIFGFYFLTSFYLYMVMAITLLSRAEGTEKVLNLVWFSTFQDSLQSKVYFVENILLFMPSGVLCRYFKKWKRPGITTTAISVGFSFSIECTQYLTGRGKFEVDDILTNTLGAAAASLLWWVIIKRRNK